MNYEVIGTRVMIDDEGNEILSETRDYGMSEEEIKEEMWLEDLKRR
jgi:hypothetical protein